MSRWTATRIAAHTTSLLRDARLILVRTVRHIAIAGMAQLLPNAVLTTRR